MDFPAKDALDAMTAEELYAALERLYPAFLEERRGLEKKQSTVSRILSNLLSAGGSGEVNHLDTRFYESVEAICAGISERLKAMPSQEAGELALRATRFVLFPEGEFHGGFAMILAACDYLCRPFLDYMDADTLAELKKSYLQHTPRRDMFPNQVKLLKKMGKGK